MCYVLVWIRALSTEKLRKVIEDHTAGEWVGGDSPQSACSGAHPNLSILSVGVGKGRSGTFVTYACSCDLNTALKAQALISVPAPKIILEHP